MTAHVSPLRLKGGEGVQAPFQVFPPNFFPPPPNSHRETRAETPKLLEGLVPECLQVMSVQKSVGRVLFCAPTESVLVAPMDVR